MLWFIQFHNILSFIHLGLPVHPHGCMLSTKRLAGSDMHLAHANWGCMRSTLMRA